MKTKDKTKDKKDKTKSKTEIITKILTPALKFWLRSQLDHVEDLDIKIHSGDTQILRGKIESVFLETTHAIYQQIHVRKVKITGSKIAVNIGGIIRGKALRLLQPIFVKGELIVEEHDLTASLSSSLLAQGLKDLLVLLLENKQINNSETILANYQIDWQEINLADEQFILTGIITDLEGNNNPLILQSGLKLHNEHTLLLDPLNIKGITHLGDCCFNEFKVDLGEDVELQELNISHGELFCAGKVKIVS